MKKENKICLFCKKEKSQSEFDIEHIILESLGGKKTKENTIHSVCKNCNNNFGRNIDAFFVNTPLVDTNPFKHSIQTLPFLGIDGDIITDKNGEFKKFKAKHKIYNIGNVTIMTAPDDNIGYFKNKLKTDISLSDIRKNTIKITSSNLRPSFEKSSLDNLSDCDLYKAIPLFFKMAYEFCCKEIEISYIENDSTFEDIRNFLNNFKINQKELILPTDISLHFIKDTQIKPNDIKNNIIIKYFVENCKIKVYINLYDIIESKINMSDYNIEYKDLGEHTFAQNITF